MQGHIMNFLGVHEPKARCLTDSAIEIEAVKKRFL